MTMSEEDRKWVRALPLLLTSSILLVFAAWAFFKGGDTTASTASFAAGLIILGAWVVTAVVDWHESKKKLKRRQNGSLPD